MSANDNQGLVDQLGKMPLATHSPCNRLMSIGAGSRCSSTAGRPRLALRSRP